MLRPDGSLFGGGGGARAVCHGLMCEGAREIRLVNRTLERARAIAGEFGGPIRVLPWAERHDAQDGAATVVNTTSQGMVVNTTSQGMVGMAALDLRLDRLPKTALAADIVYTPLESPFLAAARERGNPTVNGLGMLLHQGLPAWKMWFGVEPTVTPELRELVPGAVRFVPGTPRWRQASTVINSRLTFGMGSTIGF